MPRDAGQHTGSCDLPDRCVLCIVEPTQSKGGLMVICRALMAVFFIGVTAAAHAQGQSNDASSQMGTAEQRAACGPDVGRFCKSVKPEDGPYGYFTCLQANRAKLRPACLKVIEPGQ